jgi:hypothetical protein
LAGHYEQQEKKRGIAKEVASHIIMQNKTNDKTSSIHNLERHGQ